MKSSFRSALISAAAATLVLSSASLAIADTVLPDGDTGSPPPNIGYGSGGNDHACNTRGTAVPGKITVSYGGGSHYQPGEALTVSFSALSGVSPSVAPGLTVPMNWNDNQDEFVIDFTTTVSTSASGGTVEVTVTGNSSHYAAGANQGSGKPSFQVSVDCDDSGPVDTTPPTISLLEPTADGNNDWHRSAPVNVTINAADNIAVDHISCEDSLNGAIGVPIAVASDSTLSVTGDGVHGLTCTAYDTSGLSASDTEEVKIDTVPPVITFAGTSPSSPAGTDNYLVDWFKTSVALNWTCTDATSLPLASSVTQTLADENSTRAASQSSTGTCEDHAGWTATDNQGGINIDKTPPSLNVTGPASGDVDICAAATRPSFSPTDELSGVDLGASGDTWKTPTVFGLGSTWNYEAHADDYATNHAEETRTYVATSYGSAYSGLLQPVNSKGNSRFKLGSTIPVKFQLMCGTTPITNANATLRISQGDSSPDPGVDEAVSTAASTTGNLFRYDTSGQQYIFNLNTKAAYTNPDGGKLSFTPGTWWLCVSLHDGTGEKQTAIQMVK